MGLKFHLDEHVSWAIASALRRRGIDVTTTVEAGLTAASDLEHIAYATREGRVVYTQDDDFLSLAASGVEHCGIIYNHPESRRVRQIIEFLELVALCMTDDQMRDHIEFC